MFVVCFLVSGSNRKEVYLSEPTSDHSMRVTAEERAHPAIRKLARACIAIALLQLADDSSAETTSLLPAPPAEQSIEDTVTSSQEVSHD